MPIMRDDISGSLAALKTSLQASGLFSSVTLDSESTPTLLTCKDADANTLFTVGVSSSGWAYTVYKDASTTVALTGTDTVARPVYCYKVGADSAVVQIPNSLFIIISKTNTGGVGFALPGGTGTTANKGSLKVGCWGDEATLTTDLTFTSSSNAMVGNHTQFVEVPMHGTYEQNVYLPSAYYMPIAQVGLRGTVQEIAGEGGTYLTNGFVAVLDRASE